MVRSHISPQSSSKAREMKKDEREKNKIKLTEDRFESGRESVVFKKRKT